MTESDLERLQEIISQFRNANISTSSSIEREARNRIAFDVVTRVVVNVSSGIYDQHCGLVSEKSERAATEHVKSLFAELEGLVDNLIACHKAALVVIGTNDKEGEEHVRAH